MPDAGSLTVGITTRNRPRSLVRCLESVATLGDLVAEIIVVDDSSDPPVAAALAGVSKLVAGKVRLVVQQRPAEGYIVGRNTIMRLASTAHVLLLDDDAYLLDGRAVQAALTVMNGDARIAAIGFAQAEADGSPWPLAMQPARTQYRCRVAAYIGFAHLLRRDAFHEVGGYHEALHFYGEEKYLCARLLQAGYVVLYLPDALVAHVPDPSGRSSTRYVRYVIRNDCLFSLSNEPWPVVAVMLPIRLQRYFAMRRGRLSEDPGGFVWILLELVRGLPSALAARRPMRWRDFRLWRGLTRQPPPWPA